MEIKASKSKYIDASVLAHLLTQNESNVDKPIISLPLTYEDVDLTPLTYIIRAKNAKNDRIEQTLTKEITETAIKLEWIITDDFTSASGQLFIELVGVSSERQEVIIFGASNLNVRSSLTSNYSPPSEVLEQALYEMHIGVDKARGYADIAKLSEDNAVKQAEDASASAIAAKVNENNASISASKASQYADIAKLSEDNAVKQAEDASASAIAAKVNENNASISASKASQYADIAKYEADRAANNTLHILQITFDSDFAGLTFTVTGDGTRTGVVPSSAPYVVKVGVSLPNTTYTVAVGIHSNTVETGSYFGIYPVRLEFISTILANATWAQIESVSVAGNASSYWSIGDTKDITVLGETLTLQIYDFNHDDLTGGGKAGITFGLKNLMATTGQMDVRGTNAGGFTGSAMYTWLQGTLYNSLPSDLQTLIKNVNKKTSDGEKSTTINTNSMKVFLFSEVECFGAAPYSAAGEGIQYPIFTTNSSRVKYLSNGSGPVSGWWERSPQITNSINFCFVERNGLTSYANSHVRYCICFGFCI